MKRYKYFFNRLFPLCLFLWSPFDRMASAQGLTPKLTEAEVKAAIPVMRAEIASFSFLEKTLEADRDVRLRLARDIKSGKIDPLDWLKQRSKHILVPPGAKYDPVSSRAVSIAGVDIILEEMGKGALVTPPVQPTAVFTFGKTITAINKDVLAKMARNLDVAGELLYDINDPSYTEMRSILAKARTFYSQHGFSTGYSMTGDGIIFEPRAAEGEISGTVFQIYFTAFSPYFPRVMESCSALPIGPGIEIRAGDRMMEAYSTGTAASGGANQGGLKAALMKAGISENRYAEIKVSLLAARENSDNPGEPDPPPLNISPDTPEERQAASDYARTERVMSDEKKNQRHNMQLYIKYLVELGPILDSLQRYTVGQ